MNKLKLRPFAVAALCVLTLSACGGGEDTPTTTPSVADPTPTDGSQTRAQLAGYGYNCRTFTNTQGTTMNGNVMDQYIELNADGTFSFSSHIYQGGTCSGSHPSGGTGVAQVNMSGTYTTGGTNTTPSTATKLTFTITSYYWTIYDPQLNSLGLALANWANSCAGGSYTNYSTTATSGKVFNPTFCGNASGTIDLGQPPAVGSTFTNIAYRSGNTLQTGVTPNFIWSPGAGSFPSSYSVTWGH